MTGIELINLMQKSHRRFYVVGTPENGVIIGLDLEGRLFSVHNNLVLNRVVPSAIKNRSNKAEFQNPGGDALWPAPEGSSLGYEYNTGTWRVPPSISGAVWEVVSFSDKSVKIRSEIDLINNQQLGIPCEFERDVKVSFRQSILVQTVTETIRCIGQKKLGKHECLLAPWSLCQFDSGTKGEIRFPDTDSESDVWDMYSESKYKKINGYRIINPVTEFRFQVGLSPNIPWIEFISGEGYRVKRYSGILKEGQAHIDIADTPPHKAPSDRRVSLSVYCDPSGFLELEGCGGCFRFY